MWESFKEQFCEDILYHVRCRRNDDSITFSEDIFNKSFIAIEDKVGLTSLSEKYLCDYICLPTSIRNEQDNAYDSRFQNFINIDQLQKYVNNNLWKLVPDQCEAYDLITQNVHSD